MFGLFTELLEPVIGKPWDLVTLVAIGVGALVLGALALAMRLGSRLGELTLLLNIFALILVIVASFAAADGVTAGFGQPGRAVAQGPTQVEAGQVRRDIYHIVLDRYGSETALRALDDIDNSEFVAWLQSRGFQVVDSANANYTKTVMSLGSTLGMQPLDEVAEEMGPASRDLRPVVQRIRRSPAGAFLQQQGYEYVHVGPWFVTTERSDIADRVYNLDDARLDFTSLLYETTILPALPMPRLKPGHEQRHADTATYELGILERLVDEPGPKYVFAHVLLPHEPYVFLEDGTYDTEAATFETQLAYTNRRVSGLIESLLDRPVDERPIIVIQGDEGPYPPGFDEGQKQWDWSTASDEAILAKFGILNAMYLPGPEGEPPLRDNLSAVNTYPELLRRYFGMDIPDQPDRILASNTSRPYDLDDITERVESLEAETPQPGRGSERVAVVGHLAGDVAEVALLVGCGLVPGVELADPFPAGHRRLRAQDVTIAVDALELCQQ